LPYSFAWLGRFRRLSRDYEYLTVTSEAVIQLAMIQLVAAASADDDAFQTPPTK
jgi:transposase